MTSSQALQKKIQVWIYFQMAPHPLQVLLLKTTPTRGSFWQPVTGKVEGEESLQQAALREVHEETGLRAIGTLTDLKYEFKFKARTGEPAVESCFALKADHKTIPMLDGKEHVDFQWTTPAQALELLKFDTNRQALQHLMKLCEN